ncbi:MAG: GcrA family cell cycle regulator [Pseudomonadota bacterium]
MSWTDERVTLLRKLWVEGKTAKEIAQLLGGDVTRNAVIGKAHRLKLSNRISPIQQNEKVKIRPKTVDKAVMKNRKVIPMDMTQSTRPSTILAATPAPNALKGGIKMVDLRDRHCRWPHGDPRDTDFHFCGAPALQGLPYCDHHCRAAYHTSRNGRVTEAPEREEITLEDMVSSVVSN